MARTTQAKKIPATNEAIPQEAVRALVRWFPRAARDLPWRRTLDPYAIWVSEIMLQQTQVQTVIAYWERWMRLFPTPAALASAAEPEVLKAWEGLGYYSRARNLQKAARQLAGSEDSTFPTSAAAWIALPGIGPYTAGAISSIAYNQAEPILDGNVIRVLSRVHALPGNPAERVHNRRLWDLARGWVHAATAAPRVTSPTMRLSGACSALNQALMELGATLCTPRSPGCPDCPIQKQCRAHQRGTPEAFPEIPPRTPATKLRRVALVLEHGPHVAVRQRPAGEINGGFWEFPELDVTGTSVTAPAAAAQWTGIGAEHFESLRTLKHSITRYRIQLEVVRTRLTRRPKSFPGDSVGGIQWLTIGELESRPFTGAHRKLVERTFPDNSGTKSQ